MKILKARIQGFQSFADTQDVAFNDGINLIIGQNNSGKSAFIRALLPSIPDDRHTTPERWETYKLKSPEIFLEIEYNGIEFKNWALQTKQQIAFPIQTNNGYEKFVDDFFQLPSITMKVTRTPASGFSSDYPSHELFPYSNRGARMSVFLIPTNGEISVHAQSSKNDTLPTVIWQGWQQNMFHFVAERMTIGESATGRAIRLLPNAANLPNVLHTLSSERGSVFGKLVDHIREIFSTVGNLSIRTKSDNNALEVRVWPTETMTQLELSFPLNSSGTGVSQVIAILTAIITTEKSVIIIDEINSFLHPGAVKSLLRIIQTQYSQHQYIISTHSPEVISFSNPKTIHLVKRTGYESSVKWLDLKNLQTFKDVADHLGVSMADVFAADQVIWVEGPTEELCFPYLYQQFVGQLPRGTIITSVTATGDFNKHKRDPAIVYEVYDRLCSATATLLVSVAFSFDTEKLSESDKNDIQERSGGRLHFLPRRHLECYLIDPEAIAAFIVSKDTSSAGIVTSARVEAELASAASAAPFKNQAWNDNINDANWLAVVDAANLIKVVCGTLSEQRVPFEKKSDSLYLLKFILEHNRPKLLPLRDYVESLVKAVTTGSQT